MPVVGLGTWRLEHADRAHAIDAVRAALDAGSTHVDTAEMYGDGKTEVILGEALAGRRDEVFLVSKVVPDHASRRGTIRACEGTLRRLRTDRLDCYLLHWPGRHSLADTIAAFEELVAAGKILGWGVSNFDETQVEEAVRIAGPGRLVCNQVLYHLGERTIEHAVLPTCEKHGAAVVGYTPFDAGGIPPAGSAGAAVLAEIARRHGATPRQVILAYLVRRAPLFAIPMTARADHARENAGAGGLILDSEDIRRIEGTFPLGPPRRGVVTL